MQQQGAAAGTNVVVSGRGTEEDPNRGEEVRRCESKHPGSCEWEHGTCRLHMEALYKHTAEVEARALEKLTPGGPSPDNERGTREDSGGGGNDVFADVMEGDSEPDSDSTDDEGAVKGAEGVTGADADEAEGTANEGASNEEDTGEGEGAAAGTIASGEAEAGVEIQASQLERVRAAGVTLTNNTPEKMRSWEEAAKQQVLRSTTITKGREDDTTVQCHEHGVRQAQAGFTRSGNLVAMPGGYMATVVLTFAAHALLSKQIQVCVVAPGTDQLEMVEMRTVNATTYSVDAEEMSRAAEVGSLAKIKLYIQNSTAFADKFKAKDPLGDRSTRVRKKRETFSQQAITPRKRVKRTAKKKVDKNTVTPERVVKNAEKSKAEKAEKANEGKKIKDAGGGGGSGSGGKSLREKELELELKLVNMKLQLQLTKTPEPKPQKKHAHATSFHKFGKSITQIQQKNLLMAEKAKGKKERSEYLGSLSPVSPIQLEDSDDDY